MELARKWCRHQFHMAQSGSPMASQGRLESSWKRRLEQSTLEPKAGCRKTEHRSSQTGWSERNQLACMLKVMSQYDSEFADIS